MAQQLVDRSSTWLHLPEGWDAEDYARILREQPAGDVVFLFDEDDACVLTVDRRFVEGDRPDA